MTERYEACVECGKSVLVSPQTPLVGEFQGRCNECLEALRVCGGCGQYIPLHEGISGDMCDMCWQAVEEQAMYYEVSVLVEGALSEDRDFDGWRQAWAYISSVRDAAPRHGKLTEVFVLEHQHAPQEECECGQYLTSHNPDYVWNEDAQ